MTKAERNWVLYDVGNSAFVLLVSTIMPIYFNYLAGNAGLSSVDYLAYWGYATSAATIIVALLGPVFGTLADTKGLKKPIFTVTMLIGGIGCLALGFARQWLVFLLIYIIAKTGFSGSLIFYDSMLGDVTTEERMDNVSSQGYAWGYIGSCVPFVLCLGIVLGAGKIGISMELAMMISFAIVAVWWIGATIPLLKIYKQKHYVERKPRAIRNSFKRLGVTLKNVRNEKKIFLFLLAFFFYIDGVYTIIDMATAYGTALGFDSTKLLLALLVTQIVAFPFAIIFGKLANCYKTERLITICIGAYLGIAIFAIFLKEQWQFWILAILVGMFQGVFRQDHPTGKIRRIFRADGHMRKRRILPWNNRNQPDLAGNRTGKYRCGCDIRVLCPWNDCVPDGNRGGKRRRKESEDETGGRWGVLRGKKIVCRDV